VALVGLNTFISYSSCIQCHGRRSTKNSVATVRQPSNRCKKREENHSNGGFVGYKETKRSLVEKWELQLLATSDAEKAG
jgi:hypothetical protein